MIHLEPPVWPKANISATMEPCRYLAVSLLVSAICPRFDLRLKTVSAHLSTYFCVYVLSGIPASPVDSLAWHCSSILRYPGKTQKFNCPALYGTRRGLWRTMTALRPLKNYLGKRNGCTTPIPRALIIYISHQVPFSSLVNAWSPSLRQHHWHHTLSIIFSFPAIASSSDLIPILLLRIRHQHTYYLNIIMASSEKDSTEAIDDSTKMWIIW